MHSHILYMYYKSHLVDSLHKLGLDYIATKSTTRSNSGTHSTTTASHDIPTCIHMCTHAHISTHPHVYTTTQILYTPTQITYTHTQNTPAHIQLYAHTGTHKHTYNTYMYTQHTYAHTCTHNTPTHPHTCTCTHTHNTETHTRAFRSISRLCVLKCSRSGGIPFTGVHAREILASKHSYARLSRTHIPYIHKFELVCAHRYYCNV